ncbi:MAG: hypothetical protein ACJ77K_15175 [Bacteroidia bacterium]
MIQEKVNLRQSRDFGETFNASVRLLRQNFRVLFLSVISLAGPFVLAASIAGAYYQANVLQNTMSQMNEIGHGTFNPLQMLLSQFDYHYAIFMVAISIAQMVLMSTVYAVIVTYQEKGPGNFSVTDVAGCMGKNIANLIISYILITLITAVPIAILVGGIYVIGQDSAALAILLAILIILALLVILPPFLWQFSAIYLSVMQPNTTLVKGFARPFRIMSGNFWWTWVIVVCTTIAVALIGAIFTIPQASYQMVVMYGNSGDDIPMAYMIITTICTFLTTIVYSVMHLVFGVHYYSLVEKREGAGMIDMINEIGQAPNGNDNLHH